jgi:hypothetical protein
MRRVAFLAGLLLSLASTAAATSVSYTSSAAFLSALGASAITETYEGLVVNSLIATGSTVDGLTYTAFPAGTSGRIDNLYNRIGTRSLALQRGNDNTAFFVAGDSMTVTFPFAVKAVGIFFNVAESPEDSLTVTTTAGSAGNGPVYDQSTLYFVGLISDTPFLSATFAGGLDINSGFNLDNLTYAGAAAAVPEPASLLLLGTGIAGLVARRRRKA